MTPLTRRDTLALGALAVAGFGASRWLADTAPVARDVSANPTARALLTDPAAPRRDVPGATLTLVVFSDYRCPACRLAHPAMNAALARDGRVRVIYQEWPIFGPPSETAARYALAAAPQGIYPALHDRLMAAPGPFEAPVLIEAIDAAGGNGAQAAETLARNRAGIDARLRANAGAALALGLPGTPAYLAGPMLAVGALDESGFRRLFEMGRG